MRELRYTIWMESYIAHPFWPETDDVINIQKRSGVNRARSDEGRAKALKAHLQNNGMTLSDYEALVAKSKRQWYRLDNDHPQSPIIIPRHHLAGALVQAINVAPAAARGRYKADSFRAAVRLSDFVTEKLQSDDVFDRYVKLEGSNQRSRQQNEFIRDFTAIGRIEIGEEDKPAEIERLLAYCLSEVGIGASRKMGYGRGHIVEIKPVKVD